MSDGVMLLPMSLLSLFQRKLPHFDQSDLFEVIAIVIESIVADPLQTEGNFKQKVSTPPLIGLERDFSFILGICWNYFVRNFRMEDNEALEVSFIPDLNTVTVKLIGE